MVFSFLDPVLGPLLKLPGIVTILILSLIITLIFTLIQKYTTNQKRLKEIREEMKSYQKRIKEAKSEPETAMRLQKESMKLTGEQFRHSMRSMLFTIIPVMILFPWMASNLAFEPILSEQPFMITTNFEADAQGQVEIDVPQGITVVGNSRKDISEQVEWNLKGEEGTYLLEFISDSGKETKEILITDEQKYATIEKFKNPPFSFFPAREGKISETSKISSIKIENQKRIYINIFGGLGWLASYIIFAIVFSILIRKLIKVY